jgi:hypothetical protein
MRHIARFLLGFTGFVMIAGLAESPAALAGTALPTSIDFPGSDLTRIYGINKAGDVVGTYEIRDPAVVIN